MNLLTPAALGLAALAVPIVAMYILKMRRPVRVVPSTFLWEQALRDVQANAPWQRLRPNLLLLLQLLAVAVLVLALARPYVLRAASAQGDVVAVLDGSALMTATDVSPSRFAAARARIAALIDGLGPNDVMSIVLMARHAHVLIAESADHAALHAALDHAMPTSETPDPGAALSVATALARGGWHATIFIYTAAGDPAHLTWHPQVDLHPVALAPGSSTVIARTRLPGAVVAMRAHLIGGDDLAADDRAWAVVPTPAPRRVLLVTPGNPFLPLALSLVPGVHVDTVTPDLYTSARARGADLVVFDTWLPSRLPAAAVLAVGPPAATRSPLGLPVARPIRAAGLQPGDDPDGLLDNAGVGSAALDQATPLGVPAWAYAVLRSGGQPVLVAGQHATRREAVLGFQVFNTDWVLQPGFPILVQNLLNWLAPPLVGPSGVYRPGDAVPLAAAPSARALWVVDPARHRARVAPPFPAQPFVDTGRPGLYTVEQQAPTGVRRVLFAVNPFPVPQTGPQSAPATRRVGALHASKAQVPVELAPLVAALALVVLAGEWWVAARRR